MESHTHEPFLVRWSKFFLTRYRVSILLLVALAVGGFWGVANNQRQDFPQIPTNFIFVSVRFVGASPADVEREVIIPIEQAVEGLERVRNVRSNAHRDVGFVSIELEDAAGSAEALATLNDEVAKLGLPSDVEVNLELLDVTGPVVALGVVGGNGESTNDLVAFASAVRPRLETASPDILRVDAVPSSEFKVVVELDAAALARAGVSYELVWQTLRAQVGSLPGGSVRAADGRARAINVLAPARTVEALTQIPVGGVTLGDVATIRRLPKDDESIHFAGFVREGESFNQESAYLLVYKKADGDTIRISDAVEQAVAEIEADGLLPAGVELVTLYDTSPVIEDQLSSLIRNGWIGLVVILVVLLFFINLRTALVVALIIPLAFLVTLFALPLVGYSLNILTLFALILTLGILVDNAIVIAEGIVHELERGARRVEAALTAIRKLGGAVTAATLTTIVVFIPFASIGGIVGQFLRLIPITIIIVLVGSFFLAVSITPLLGRWLLREQTYEQRRAATVRGWEKALVLPALVHWGQNVIDWLSRFYRFHMRQTLSSRWKRVGVVVLTLALFAVSFGVFAPRLDFEQFPSNDSPNLLATIEFPVGTSLEERKEVFRRVGDAALGLPYFQNFYVFGNELFFTFTDPAKRTDETTIHDLLRTYEERLDQLRADVGPETKIRVRAAGYGPPESTYDIIVELLANDQAALEAAVDDLVAFVEAQGGADELRNGIEADLVPAIEVTLGPRRLAARGVDPSVAARTVNATFAPQTIGSIVVREDGVSDDLVLAFGADATDSVEDLRGLSVPTRAGGAVRLADVADIDEVERANGLVRLNGRRTAALSIRTTDDEAGAALEAAIKGYLTEDKLRELGLTKDAVVYGGEFATFAEDYSNLQLVFLLAVIAVYLILVWQFDSFLQPILIMLAVPLAFIGVFPGLFLVGSSLNMISGLGVIALVGIVVNDAIVFLSTYNRYRHEGRGDSVVETLVEVGRTRFKPIFSTSITTIGGILPLTIADPFWTGLGTSIIAGLVFSTLGTLVVIPTVYAIASGWRRRRRVE